MSLRMSRDMVPTVRLVAFLVFTDGTVVADSEVLRVVGRCSEVRKTTPTPTGADPEGGATGGGGTVGIFHNSNPKSKSFRGCTRLIFEGGDPRLVIRPNIP